MDSGWITLLQFVGFFIAAGLAYMVGRSQDRSKSDDDELTRVVKEIEQIKATAVGESRVREIVKDCIEPIGSDVKETKNNINDIAKVLHNMEIKLAAEMAYKRGVQDKDRSIS